MDIIIHTYGRSNRQLQHTLRQLVSDGIKPVLVVQAREQSMYGWYDGPVYVLPENITKLAETRDYIIHDMVGTDHVVFMDDDLHFAVRRDDDPTKFRQPTMGDLRAMLGAIDSTLRTHPMVGIGSREGGNRVTEQYVYNSRIMRVLAFRRSYLKKHHITFTPLVVMEDFHVNLQVLRSGADTCILNNWVSNQAGGSNAPGGCSVYRTDAVQTAAAHMLASRHPGFVKVVQKPGWGKNAPPRTDVMVYWKKARASAEELK